MTVTSRTNPMSRFADDPLIAQFRWAREEGLNPFFHSAEATVAPEVVVDGERRIMLASANYLGLANHPDVVRGAREAIDQYGSTITGSRLLNGTTALHVELEEELASWTGREAALVFTTGYQANLGTISSLVTNEDTVVVDKSDHASLLDGCSLSRAKLRAFGHNRMDLLRSALEKATRDDGATLVIVDGLYSMHGDIAPIDEIVPLCREFDVALMVDEAHSTGVLGERGTGTAELFGLDHEVDVHMGALSKALGATGGFIAGSNDLIDFLRTRARAFLFTTAGVPAALGASLAAVRLRQTAEGAERAEQTLENARFLWEWLRDLGLRVVEPSPLPDGGDVVSPIVPVIMGEDLPAAHWWRALWERGVFTSAAMYPAVKPSSAILRLCVMATHTREQLERTVAAFEEVKRELGPPQRA
jgi:8-amino-7-oxononanoate synthase